MGPVQPRLDASIRNFLMKNLVNLAELNIFALSKMETFNQSFRRLHHFSKHPPFKTSAPTYEEFVRYCGRLKLGIQRDGENERTIQRAYHFLAADPLKSEAKRLIEAWRNYPIIRKA